MIPFQVPWGDTIYDADIGNAHSIAIRQTFAEDQVNLFGAPKATCQSWRTETFVGATRHGGGCNVEQWTIVPHCNGTHTESAAHIVDDHGPVADHVGPCLTRAVLLTTHPAPFSSNRDSYEGAVRSDRVISAHDLQIAFEAASRPFLSTLPDNLPGLIVRTAPNPESKTIATYGAAGPTNEVPPYFSREAMDWIVQRNVRHLLVDFPSIDRIHDSGRLANHHHYWNIPMGVRTAPFDTRWDRTITELVYVADDICDGPYLLNLQIADMATDAVPSRPVLIPLIGASSL